ncbi:MAG: hypothetical protein JKY54_17960 [Flavobacteriales bacterium]|nr:hypothetical protein [Flavobacteriales bacterium]
MKVQLVLYISFIAVLFFSSCDRFVRPENDTQVSSFDDDESHYNNQNCMDCHYSEGRGEGWFSVAGTVSGNTNLATIELYLNPTDAPIATLEVDTKGNFYTTNSVDFSQGLYAGVRSNNGSLKMMDAKLNVGQCNLCHSATTTKISIN